MLSPLILALALSQQPREDGFEAQLLLIPRLSEMSGDADDDLGVGYDDLFGGGIGFTVEADFYGLLGRSWKLGGYVATGFDAFPGEEAGGGGTTLKPDTLTTTHLMAGIKAALAPDGGFYFDVRAGMGMVFYTETDGTLTVGGTPSILTIFDATAAFAAEIGFHFGYSSEHVVIAAGFAGRFQGPPDEADLAFEDVGGPFVGSFEVEVAFRF